MTKITHDIVGDRVLISADFPGENVTAHQDGTCRITMDDTDWRETAKSVLHEYNRAEKSLDPDVVLSRIRGALDDAAARAATTENDDIARMRLVSTVLHRIADLVQSGTVIAFASKWSQTSPRAVLLSYSTKYRSVRCDVELGKGITNYQIEDHQ